MIVFLILEELARHASGEQERDTDNERNLLNALKSAKKYSKDHPLSSCISLLVAFVVSTNHDSSTTTNPLEVLEFILANLDSRSHSRLFLIAMISASVQGPVFVQQLHVKIENAIKDSDRITTLFGLGTLFLIEKFKMTPSQTPYESTTKEFYHSWLSKLITSSNRRTHQFLASLLQSTFATSPSDFNCATLLAIRNHSSFKSLATQLKNHLSDSKDVDETKLVQVGVLNVNEKRRNTLEGFLKEFQVSNQIPKSLSMEMLVNDAWFKNHFLPKLMTRSDSTSNQDWKLQQSLFELLRKTGRVPASFLASRTAALVENIQSESALSLQNLDNLKSRIQVSLQVFIELEDSADALFQQDCLQSIQTLLKQIESLFKTPPNQLSSFKAYIDLYGDLECSNLYCNPTTIAIVDVFLNCCTKFKNVSVSSDSRFSKLVGGFITLAPSTLPTLVLRLFSLMYGVADLSKSQAVVLARILYHVCVWIPGSFFLQRGQENGSDETEQNNAFSLFFSRYMHVACPPHMDFISETLATLIESKPWSQQQATSSDHHEMDPKESEFLAKSLASLQKLCDRREQILVRRNWTEGKEPASLLPVYMSSLQAYEWAIWEVSCMSGRSPRHSFLRMQYVRRSVNVLMDPVCRDDLNSNARLITVSELLRGVCDGLLWIDKTAQRNNGCKPRLDSGEGTILICTAISDFLNEELDVQLDPEDGDVGVLFGFLDASRFLVFFDLFHVIPVKVLWGFGDVDAVSGFWEGRFKGAEGCIGWKAVSDAAVLVFEGAVVRRKLEAEVAVLESFMSKCPTVAALLLANPSLGWCEDVIPIYQLLSSGILSILKQPLSPPFNQYPDVIAKAGIFHALITKSKAAYETLSSIAVGIAMDMDETVVGSVVVDVGKQLLQRLHDVVAQADYHQGRKEDDILEEVMVLNHIMKQ
ncbi:UNVERIFIED_CONTAM: hypothetical protein HDU68_003987 [Siphonaria sp. JEL0065]|nr:hypothetical protein HDU68_003987 [Siphonaria sp. JEL0065]